MLKESISPIAFYLLSQLSEHLSSVNERHAKVQVAVVLQRELQIDNERKLDGL